ncbi:sensor histidine kinase [Chitinophagaceae bacterium LWZ2-11]
MQTQGIADNIYILIIIGMIGTLIPVVLFILLQVRNKDRLLRQQKKIQEAEINHHKELLQAIISSEEKERRRIGMDLHDDVGSALSSLRMVIESFISRAGDEPESASFSKQSKSIIDRVITDVRNISHNLSPLTKGAYSFIDAIEDLCENMNLSGKINVQLTFNTNDSLTLLNETTALALYRVISELINNTCKHAEANNIFLQFNMYEKELVIDYKDDGKGLPANITSNGMGMHNIESRLGMAKAEYKIADTPDKGFEIQIKLMID